MLSERQAQILRIVVSDYVATAIPVGSEALVRRYGLPISSATIRNEMASLEEQGYITHPHTSAGRVPADKGYRYYVEALMVEAEVPEAEQLTIRHQFHQVERELEQWSRLTAALLARMARNAAMVTVPRANEAKLKHIELVLLQEFLALLIVVLQEAKLKQQILTFDEPVTQQQLDVVANRLNAVLAGRNTYQIAERSLDLAPLEQQVHRSVVRMLQASDEQGYEDIYLDGLRHIFRQPEFASSAKMQQMLEVLEEKRLLAELLPRLLAGEGVQVIIGHENREDAMRECSVVLTRYGLPGEATGIMGVVGPTRMAYERIIPSVRYMGWLMSEMLAELYG